MAHYEELDEAKGHAGVKGYKKLLKRGPNFKNALQHFFRILCEFHAIQDANDPHRPGKHATKELIMSHIYQECLDGMVSRELLLGRGDSKRDLTNRE